MSLNNFVDAAVDQVARTAKTKVKSLFTGKDAGKSPSKSGGMGGLFPTAGAGGEKSKGGLFGGLLSAAKQNSNPGGQADGAYGGQADGGYGGQAGGGYGGQADGGYGGQASGGNADFNAAIDELGDL